MGSLSNWQLIIGVVLAGFVSLAAKRNGPGILGFAVALVATGFAFGTGAPGWIALVACLGIGLGLSPLLTLSEDDPGVPAILLISASAVVCGSVTPDHDFFAKAALFASGIGLGSLLTGRALAGGGVALATLTIGAADTLGRAQLTNPQTPPGLALTAVVVAPLLVALGLRSLLKSDWKATILGTALAAALGYFVCNKLLFIDSAGFMAIAGAIAAGAIVWALPETESSEPISLIGAIVMVAVGTAAFAEARGIGMATAAVAAIAVGLLSGRTKVLAVISPLAILAVYRGFGVVNPAAAKALDIGQHYGMIGLMLGILVAFVGASRSENTPFPASAFGWLAGALLCAFSPLVIGAKGAVGLLVGLGFAGAIGHRNALAAGMSFMGITITGYSLLKDRLDLTREERLPLLAGVAAGVFILIIASFLLGRQKSEALA